MVRIRVPAPDCRAACIKRKPYFPAVPEPFPGSGSGSTSPPGILRCRPRCQRVRFLVFCATPYTSIPGAPKAPTPTAPSPTTPPGVSQVPLTAGTPWDVRLTGSSAAFARSNEGLPSILVEKYGQANIDKHARSIVFDFWGSGGEATGTLVGIVNAGCHQASLKFRYRWCGPQYCAGTVLPQFQVTGCTYDGARFLVLDDTTYLSSDPCTESVVVLLVQQWCDAVGTYEDVPAADQYLTDCAVGRVPCVSLPCVAS